MSLGVLMSVRRRLAALIAGAAVVVAAGLVFAPNGLAAITGSSAALVACSAPAWAEGVSYAVGDKVTYNGHLYQALVAHTPPPGAGWNPVAAASLWKDLGACDGG